MQIRILAVGKTREKYLQMGVEEFKKRLAPYARLELLSVAEEKLADSLSPREEEQVMAREGERLLKLLKPGEYVIALDAGGRSFTSEELAQYLSQLALHGRSSLAFLIGGHLGLAPAVRSRSDLVLSLSPLTFTHQMVRLILLEQLYRAFKIMRGEPYHK
ncbi:MAG TPA: 23S rRNA (pseudouridine(1915)-N(3))-methyltransferase RlmH [Firmicutes bacterium]|nr:23S rRNA (pseudouridine(1915)-N(3))-methyltransferase RlmH [Bacillota bacterium]